MARWAPTVILVGFLLACYAGCFLAEAAQPDPKAPNPAAAAAAVPAIEPVPVPAQAQAAAQAAAKAAERAAAQAREAAARALCNGLKTKDYSHVCPGCNNKKAAESRANRKDSSGNYVLGNKPKHTLFADSDVGQTNPNGHIQFRASSYGEWHCQIIQPVATYECNWDYKNSRYACRRFPDEKKICTGRLVASNGHYFDKTLDCQQLPKKGTAPR